MTEEFKNDTNYLDQHFLVDKSIFNTFIEEANLSVYERVVEIGPGKCEISDSSGKKNAIKQRIQQAIAENPDYIA